MSDTVQRVAIEELVQLTTQVALKRSIPHQRASAAARHLAFCISHQLADSDVLETTLVALAPEQVPARPISNKANCLIYTAKGQPTATNMEDALSTFMHSDAEQLRIHETLCGVVAVAALAEIVTATGYSASYYYINLDGKERRIDIADSGQITGVSEPRERTLAWNEVRVEKSSPTANCRPIKQMTDITHYQQQCQQHGVPIRVGLWQRMQVIAE
ncbi:MAG: hypothetical protein QF872_09485 [Gammaproteobacteria bacterium]|jgi:hypothetical protein|nr:hypothetical protein [Gammaproteobacteria bacterium]